MFTLEEILKACCDICDVTVDAVRSQSRLRDENIARGLFFIVAIHYKYHPKDVGAYVGRSRPSTIITAQRYYGYLYIGDILINTLYSAVIDKLNS